MNDRENAIIQAVSDMATIPGFPFDDLAKNAVWDQLDRMCSTPDAIIWLGRKIANSYTKWPGLLTVRAVWCSRYPPADGNEASLGCDDPVGSEIHRRAELPKVEERAGRQITEGELRMIAGAVAKDSEELKAAVVTERMRAQSMRWAACVRRLPNLAHMGIRKRFSLSQDPEEREQLLLQAERAAFATVVLYKKEPVA